MPIGEGKVIERGQGQGLVPALPGAAVTFSLSMMLLLHLGTSEQNQGHASLERLCSCRACKWRRRMGGGGSVGAAGSGPLRPVSRRSEAPGGGGGGRRAENSLGLVSRETWGSFLQQLSGLNIQLVSVEAQVRTPARKLPYVKGVAEKEKKGGRPGT